MLGVESDNRFVGGMFCVILFCIELKDCSGADNGAPAVDPRARTVCASGAGATMLGIGSVKPSPEQPPAPLPALMMTPSTAVEITAGRLPGSSCPPGRHMAFLPGRALQKLTARGLDSSCRSSYTCTCMYRLLHVLTVHVYP